MKLEDNRLIRRLGNFENKFILYENSFYPDDQALVAFRGDDKFDSGYVCGIYLPFSEEGIYKERIEDEITIMHYDGCMVHSDYYGKITLKS